MRGKRLQNSRVSPVRDDALLRAHPSSAGVWGISADKSAAFFRMSRCLAEIVLGAGVAVRDAREYMRPVLGRARLTKGDAAVQAQRTIRTRSRPLQNGEPLLTKATAFFDSRRIVRRSFLISDGCCFVKALSTIEENLTFESRHPTGFARAQRRSKLETDANRVTICAKSDVQTQV